MREWGGVNVECTGRRDDVNGLLPFPMPAFRRSDGLSFCYFVLGCGFLTPWNALLSAVDYFEGTYPMRSSDSEHLLRLWQERDVLRLFSICCIPTTLLAVLVNGVIPARDRGHFRMSCALVVFVLSLLSLPLVPPTSIHSALCIQRCIAPDGCPLRAGRTGIRRGVMAAHGLCCRHRLDERDHACSKLSEEGRRIVTYLVVQGFFCL